MKKRLSLILFILLSGDVAAQNNNKLPANAETFIKNQFKQLFLTKQNEIFDVIWNNNNLRTSLFSGRTESAARTYFTSLVDNESSVLYNFIKVE
jgi:hypothetical protein